MALIKCKECGHEVSDKALKCPKCGGGINEPAIRKNKTNGKGYVIGVVVAIVLLMGMAAFYFLIVDNATIQSQPKMLMFHDVFDKAPIEYDENGRVIKPSDYDNVLNENIETLLKERGYSKLGTEEHEEQRFNERYDPEEWMAKVVTIRYGYNIIFSGYWEPQGSPCQGVEIVLEDGQLLGINLYFETIKEMRSFIIAAKEKGFEIVRNTYVLSYDDYNAGAIDVLGEKAVKCMYWPPRD